MEHSTQQVSFEELAQELSPALLRYLLRLAGDQAVADDERAVKGKKRTVIEVPAELVPMIRAIIAQFKPARKT